MILEAEDISVLNDVLLVNDERMINRINNEKELEELADFFVARSFSEFT